MCIVELVAMLYGAAIRCGAVSFMSRLALYYLLPVSFCIECRGKCNPTGLQIPHVVSDRLLVSFLHIRVITNICVFSFEILELSLICG